MGELFFFTYYSILPVIDIYIAALGYLIGPSVGATLFSLTHPSIARGNPAPLEVMDREFYHRIKKNRADPRFQSVQNIVPDFYGEKVGPASFRVACGHYIYTVGL